MPFTLIEGTFHLVSRRADGTERGFQPDGDSLQFRPRTPALLDRLIQLQHPYRLSPIGSVQLRFEGIDALELHFLGAAQHQPRPLADHARDAVTGLLGLNPIPYAPPHDITVMPPVERDAAPGFIVSRSLEIHGRPVAFAFAGAPPNDGDGRAMADGDEIFLDRTLLRQSLNYALVRDGHAYPLFYDTLFADLRGELANAARRARQAGRGAWPRDASERGLMVDDAIDLEADGVIFPKLFRRLSEYLGEGIGGLDGFLSWLAATREQVLDLLTTNVTHFDNLVAVENDTVRMLGRPEDLVFISAK
jgi:endonuclease YncB( thermonuclease family)